MLSFLHGYTIKNLQFSLNIELQIILIGCKRIDLQLTLKDHQFRHFVQTFNLLFSSMLKIANAMQFNVNLLDT